MFLTGGANVYCNLYIDFPGYAISRNIKTVKMNTV